MGIGAKLQHAADAEKIGKIGLRLTRDGAGLVAGVLALIGMSICIVSSFMH